MSREKPKAIVLADLREVDAALAELAALRREISAVEGVMNDAIDNIKAEAKSKTEPLTSRTKTLEIAVANFAAARKAEFFSKKKSLELTFGVFGFRKSSKLKTLKSWTWGGVLERLKELVKGSDENAEIFGKGIRCKEEVAKDVIGDWPPERQVAVGVQLSSEDEFFYELKAEEIQGEAA